MITINRPRRTRRKASILIVSLIAIFLATAISAIMIQMAGGTRTANISARQQSDTIRCATNLIEFAGQQLKSKLNRPSAQFPREELKGGFKEPQVATGDYAAVLGVDTTRYTIVSASWKLNAADPSNPVTTNWDSESKEYAPYAAVFAGSLNLNNPINLSNPCKNNYIAKIWSIPVSATVTLVDKGSGKRTSLTATCNVQVGYTPFLQYSYYFSGINAQISQGIQTRQRGGIFGNKDINLWTTDTTGYSKGAIIQVDNISGKNLYFNNLNNGVRGSNNAFNGVYISAGDMNGNGKLDYFADMGKPLSNPYNPYATTASSILSDFLPAFQTAADMGADRNTYANNFSYLTSSNFASYNATNTDTTNYTNYYKIDSNNPNIATLSQRFNGNYTDSQTGFKEQYPSTFPTAMTDGTVDAHAMIDPPTSAGRSAGVGTTERDVENSKFANSSRFYVLVENPSSPTSVPLDPVVFDDPGVAIKYKEATNGLTDADKLLLRTKFASHIISLPGDVIQVRRSFYDMSQNNAGGNDPTKNIRISAVDINMGSLRNAIGSADAPGAKLSMADGSLWNANDSATGWNGVVYVDVTNPKGNGWVSYDKSGNALGYNSTTTDEKTGVPSDPVLTKLSDTKTAVSDPLGSADERLVAVRLYNANTVPDRTGVAGYSGTAGVTLATNTSVYTIGDINADGNAATDKSYGKSFASPTATGADPKTAPFCIACDSLTAFSSAYYQGDATHTTLDIADQMLDTNSGRVTQPAGFDKFHEMNFALISGGADMSLRKSYGSGSLNPAFVINIPIGENRNGLNVRYRGARNVLFASKYNRKYFNNNGSSYENSNDEAFDQTLRGLNASPPGMPSVKQFSLVNFHLSGS